MVQDKGLNVCFVGIGSIAKRHIGNLREICLNRNIPLCIDALRRDATIEDNIGFGVIYDSPEKLPSDYDVIFVTNPTDIHIDTLEILHSKAKHFFIEKPITSYRNLEKARTFPYREDSIYYIACPMRYIKVMQYIKESIDIQSVIAVRSICSSYLPDWRPGIDYRECYSAHKDMGGGVSIDLIHEWDYLVYLFGIPSKVSSIVRKVSSLEIDSDDTATYIADYGDKIVELHLDYYGREKVREMMLIMKDDTIVVDFVGKTIKFLKAKTVKEFPEDGNDQYIVEMEHFLDMVSGEVKNDNPPWQACKIMELTQGQV